MMHIKTPHLSVLTLAALVGLNSGCAVVDLLFGPSEWFPEEESGPETPAPTPTPAPLNESSYCEESRFETHNLLENGGAECAMDGWEGDFRPGREVTAYAGSYHFFAGKSDVATLSQEVELTGLDFSETAQANGELYVHASGYLRSYANAGSDDLGQIEVKYIDDMGVTRPLWQSKGYHQSDWQYIEGIVPLPINAQSLIYTFHSTRMNGEDNDGYLDNARLWITEDNTQPCTEAVDPTNLLYNASAECGLEGWQYGETWQSLNATWAEDGTHIFFAGEKDIATLHQRIDLAEAGFTNKAVDDGLVEAYFGGHQRSYFQVSGNLDTGVIALDALDDRGQVLERIEGERLGQDDWVGTHLKMPLPPGTRSVRYAFTAYRHAGLDNDAYLDDAYLRLYESVD